MANSLNVDLADCVVVLGREHFPADDRRWDAERARTVLVRGGVGAKASVRGSWMWVTDENGAAFRAHGWMVRRLVRRHEPQVRTSYDVAVMGAQGVDSFEVVATSALAASHRVLHDLGWMQTGHAPRESHGDMCVEVNGAQFVVSARAMDA